MQTFSFRNLQRSVLALSLGCFVNANSWADSNAARAKVQTLCQVCHGMDGVAILTEAPNLSGQQKGYLIAQLRLYRAGTRHDPQMNIVAKSLSDADIENLADWYSAIKIKVEPPK